MKSEGKETNGKWPEVSFGEIFEISSSKRVLEAQWKTAGVPFYRAREIVKLAKVGAVQNELFISEELYREYQAKYGVPKPGDLMISAVGTLGACYVVQPSDRFYYKDASVLRFSPKQPVCSRFIQHAFGTNHILDQVHAGSGSTVGTYTISRANETRLPLPPLAEQRRIAEVLDRAEALRAQRRAALAQLDSLTQSLFLDLFGDPKNNPKKWPCVPFAELGENQDSQRVPVKSSDRGGRQGKYPYYGASGIIDWVDDFIYDSERLLIGEDGANLVARATPVAYIARGQYWVNNHAHVIADNGRADLRFLEFFIEQLDLKPFISGTAQPKLNRSNLDRIAVPFPPIPLQREFARRVTAVEALKTAQRASLAELDALFATLQHRAFRGEL